jgi:hypothetical protein
MVATASTWKRHVCTPLPPSWETGNYAIASVTKKLLHFLYPLACFYLLYVGLLLHGQASKSRTDLWNTLSIYIYIYIYTHTHTHTFFFAFLVAVIHVKWKEKMLLLMLCEDMWWLWWVTASLLCGCTIRIAIFPTNLCAGTVSLQQNSRMKVIGHIYCICCT